MTVGGKVQPGEVLDGKYAVERIVGQGGTGYVVVAQHLILHRRVALKFLRPELAAQPELGRRFLREAQAAAQMKGDHVARVMDADTLRTGEPYLVMEFLEGEDMAAVVQRLGPLSVGEATGYLLQACEAVHEAHALKVVHRDLKPGNLFLTKGADGKPYVKVLDFGLSKVLTSDWGSQSLTDSNHVVGSPHYMSPEQIRTPREVDERTDIWSLGATLFTMLTGHVPFDGRSMIEVCGALLCGPAPRVGRFRDDVPTELEEVVLRCLRVDPADRYPSVVALSRALAPFGADAAHPSFDRTQSFSDSADVEAPMTAPRVASVRGEKPPASRLAVVLGVIVLVGLVTAWGLGRLATLGVARPAPTDGPPPTTATGGAPASAAITAVAESSPAGLPAGTPEPALGAGPSAPRESRGVGDTATVAKARPSSADLVLRATAPPSAAVPSAQARAAAAPPVFPTTPGVSTALRRDPIPASASSASQARARNPNAASSASAEPAACDNPFYIDGQGIKTIRPECL
jgi:serine/threonine-protein kinase